jgi:hypothetical protein
MFTLLSGHTVHDGESAQRMVFLAASKAARSLAAVLPDADREIVALVDRALARNREDRWPSARAMHAAICETSKRLLGDSQPSIRDSLAAKPKKPTAATTAATTQLLPMETGSDEPTRIADVSSLAPTRHESSWTGLRRAIDNARAFFRPTPPAFVESSDDVTKLRDRHEDLEVTRERPPARPPPIDVAPATTASVTPTVPNRPGAPAILQKPRRRGADDFIVVLHATARDFWPLGLAFMAICAIVACVAIFVIRHRPNTVLAPVEEPPTTTPAEIATAPASSVTASETTPEPSLEAPEPTPAKTAAPVVAHSAPTPAGAPRQPPNRCVPPYDIDATGKKHWKLDCL